MSETHFKLEYKVTGHGWASCKIELGDQRARATASYLSDALKDLVSAVILLKTSGHPSGASFTEEPGEFRWQLSYVGKGDKKRSRVRVRVLEFKEWQVNRTHHLNTKGSKKVIDGIVDSDLFFNTFLKMLNDILEEHTVQEYQELWAGSSMPFPMEKYQRLADLIHDKPMS